jgi:hypothetical protein
MKIASRFSILFFTFILSACVATGEVNPKNDINLVGTGKVRITTDAEPEKGTYKGFTHQIGITHLNGKSLWRMGVDNDFPESLLISPGKIQLRVRYIYFSTYADGVLWLEAEPEKEYFIKKVAEKYSVNFYIEEKDTGKIVGGVFEPEKNM